MPLFANIVRIRVAFKENRFAPIPISANHCFTMHRLFVAIRPPQPIRDLLTGLMGGVRGARWRSDEQLHLTLRFIGEVDRHVAHDVHAALGSIHQARFEIEIAGLHSFDHRGEATILWAGVTPHEPLKALHKKVDQACLKAGIAPDHRAYLPHITLARLGGSSEPVHGLLENEGGVTSSSFLIDNFCLFESERTSDGPIYSVIERYRLD